MGKHPNNIENEIAYFYAVLKNMDLKDSITQSKIRKHEVPLEENIYYHFSYLNNMDKQLSNTDSFNWIELIENDNLRDAIGDLSIDEKTLLHYVFYEEKTQSEIAEIYDVTHQNVSKKIIRILKKIKSFLLNK